MKKLLHFITLVLFVFLLSCTSIEHSYRQANIPEQNLVVMPVLVDVNVDLNKRVYATSPKVKGVENAISTAYYYALESSGADVIIDPVYKVVTGKKSIATVTGYYGKYSNARKIIEAVDEFESIDTTNVKKALWLINGFKTQETQTKEATTGKQKKKSLK